MPEAEIQRASPFPGRPAVIFPNWRVFREGLQHDPGEVRFP